MKSPRFDTTVLMFAALLVLCMFPVTTVAEDYLGEFCWDSTEGGAFEPTGLVRLHVYLHEGGDYSLRGTMEDFALSVENVINGNAAVVPVGPMADLMVSATLHGSNPVGTALINMMLDPATLDGSHSGVVVLTQPSLTAQPTTGVMTFAKCP